MESNQPLDNNFAEGLHLSGQSRSYLRETAKWGRFLAIVGFVMLGLLVLMGIFAGSAMGLLLSGMPGADASLLPTGLFTAYFLIFAVIYFFPIYYLYKFSNQMKLALNNDDEMSLESSFSNLKSLYKFMGILTIIMLALYAIGFFFAIVGGLMIG